MPSRVKVGRASKRLWAGFRRAVVLNSARFNNHPRQGWYAKTRPPSLQTEAMVKASEKNCRSETAEELDHNKARCIGWANRGERIARTFAQASRCGLAKEVQAVGAACVKTNRDGNSFRTQTSTAVNDAKRPEGRNELAEKLPAACETYKIVRQTSDALRRRHKCGQPSKNAMLF